MKESRRISPPRSSHDVALRRPSSEACPVPTATPNAQAYTTHTTARHGMWAWLLLVCAVVCLLPHEVLAQNRRGPRTIIRKGMMVKPDTLACGTGTLALEADSLLYGSQPLSVDSTGRMISPAGVIAALDPTDRLIYVADTLSLDSLGLRPAVMAPPEGMVAAIDSASRLVYVADTLALDSLGLRAAFVADTLSGDSLVYRIERLIQDDNALISREEELARSQSVLLDTTRRGGCWLMRDSMSLSKVCWISTVLPGYGQVYNKQYWKLPILYGTLGTGLALFIHENNHYRPIKKAYDRLTLMSTDRDAALAMVQTKMIRSNTRRQLYLGLTVASYIYFLGDVAVNYSTNDVSNVKKATTLACICPGAGQIYNKSYWKVPFVVGGFASMIYCIDWNNRGYQRFKKAYSLRTAYDNNREAYPNGSPDEFNGRVPASTLKSYKDSYRRNRDLCIIITAGIYVLQIIDAHLKDYDISDDLSMNLEPLVDLSYIPAEGGNRPIFGFNMSINF